MQITAIIVILVTFLTSTDATSDGKVANEDSLIRSLQQRIIGGSQAALGEFPFFVDWGGQCGASLIHDDIVLSAAHCDGVQGSLRISALSFKTNTGVQVRSIARSVVHPNFNKNTLDNDFIVLKLNQAVTGVTPVLLNADSSSPATGDVLTVIGFGATKNNGQGSDTLLKVNVDFIPFSQCNPAYAAEGAPISDSVMLCAGDKNGIKDSCQGDSGGPLFKLVNGIPTQVGVVSWGFDCADPLFSGIYSRVSSAKTWIDKMVCDHSSTPPARCGGGPNPTPPTGSPPSRAPTPSPPTGSPPTRTPTTPSPPTGSPPTRAPTTQSPPTGSTPTRVPTTQSPPSASVGKVTVRVDIKTDEYPEETSWSIKQGDTVVFERSAEYFATLSGLVSDRVMLVPGVAYTFEIFDTEGDGICCRYGNGNFNVYAEIGGTDVLLVEGYARFGYSDLFVFSVPANPNSSSTVAPARAPVIAPISAVTGPPTKAPIVITSSPASLPTGSPPTASTGRVSVRVDITTDEYPEETSWSIKLGNTVIFEQPAGSLTPWNSLVSERVVLVPGVSYTFEISDTEGDGICCRYGNGNFVLYAEIGGKSVRLLGGNGRFGDSSLFVFSVSTDPSSSTTIAPTRAPVPTGSPPTATSTGKVSVRVDIMTDDYPEETSWSIKQGNTVIFEQPAESLTSWNSLVSERVMLVAGATYTFEISDTEGDGICCRYGNGNFVLYAEIDGKDVRLVGGNGGFASSVQIVFTVPASTTLATIAPVTAPSKAPTRAPSGGFCFSGEATVQVKDMGTMPMKKLKIGDRVLTASGNYDAVYSFGHRHESVEATFLQFVPSGLEISKDHMLLVGGKFVPASSVKIGDHLESASGDLIHVEAIRSVDRNGVYAPFTTSGTIVVSNVKASNYIAFQDSGRLIVSGWETPVSFQWIAHMSQSPHRIYSHYLGWSKTEEYTEDGRSTWISGLHELSLWLLNQNGAVMTMMLIPAAGLGMLSMAAESIISWFV